MLSTPEKREPELGEENLKFCTENNTPDDIQKFNIRSTTEYKQDRTSNSERS